MTVQTNDEQLRVAIIEGSHRFACAAELNECETLEVIRYPSGRDALRSSDLPSIWILSRALSDMSGFCFIEMLSQVRPQARFFLIAEQFDADEERRCFEVGAKYLCQPMAEHWLLRLLKSEARNFISQT